MSKRYTKKQNIFHLTSIAGLIIAIWCCQIVAKPVSKFNKPSQHRSQLTNIKPQPTVTNPSDTKLFYVPDLNPRVLSLALKAYKNAKSLGLSSKPYLTIVDYSMPSTQPRMWVIDMHKRRVVHHTHVAHGTATGDNYARNFSNRHGSHMSSLGTFVTGKLYQGRFGKSLELHGLDAKFNSNAYARRIVVHAANYVDEKVIRRIGRLGRSFGCLALNTRVANEVMHLIKEGSLVFCYYPDSNWLYNSNILNP